MSAADKTILMVVTGQGEIDADHPTGLWLEEFAIPWQLFCEAGFKVTVASPLGGNTPLDPRSLEDDEQVVAWRKAQAALAQTTPLRSVAAHSYAAVFLPGGHGTMFDLPACHELQALLRSQYEAGRIVAAVCHGPAGLVDVLLSDGQPLVSGKRLTAFTDAEERAVELDGLMPFLLETELRRQGANFIEGDLWSSHVEVDGNLVTGQNPASSGAAAEAVIALLKS